MVLRIAIVGGGPGGLTLGNLLHKRNIPFTIFDLRPQITDEELDQPAGPLDLHEDTGLAALRDLGLFDEFKKLTGDCTEAQVVANKDGEVLYRDEGENSNRPEISRHKLIRLLLKSLLVSTIQWNHKLISTQRLSTDEIELDFGSNGKKTFDLVVGADGAWSKVRPLLTDSRPEYSGFQLFTLNIRQLNEKHPQLASLVGSGNFSCLGERHMIASQRSVIDSARIWIFLSTQDEYFATTQGLTTKTPAEAKDFILGSDMPFRSWGQNIQELLAVACEDESRHNHGDPVDIKALYRLPVGHCWKHQIGITLIGDAAHVMNPGAGDGVNLAMKEALILANAIAEAHPDNVESKNKDQLNHSLQKFEQAMWTEARDSQEGTVGINEMMFPSGGDDGARRLADFFQSMAFRE